MFGPGTGQCIVVLGLGKVHLNPARVQKCFVKVLFRCFRLILCLEAHKAKLSGALILEHDFGISDISTLGCEVGGQVNLFQVLWQVFDNQTTHFLFLSRLFPNF